MTEHLDRATLTALDRLLDDVPVRPVPPGLVERSAAGRRSRRGVVVLGAAAAVVLVVGVGVVVSRLVGGGPEVETYGTILRPKAPSETREVGIGRVTVEVPTEWETETSDCGLSHEGRVYFDDAFYLADCVSARHSSIFIGSRPPVRPRLLSNPAPIRGPLRARGEIDGHQVLAATDRGCSRPGSIECRLYVGVPDLAAWFTISVRGADGGSGLVREIVRSISVLPTGQTTVPPVSPYLPRETRWTTRQLRSAGFVVEVRRLDCGGAADCDGLGIEPEPGTVVDVGSTVTVTAF